MRTVLSLVALCCCALAVGVAPATATSECRGLQICVPVAGPWVVIPTGHRAPRPRVEYQLSCPPGYVVGGLDAELSDRAIDIAFLGKTGSPVNPGITTSRAAVFVAVYVGTRARAPSFRPHIGCLPATGGGVRVPTSVAAFPPGQPTVRRVRTVSLTVGGAQRIAQRCLAGEQLVQGSHAVGFYTESPPSERIASSVRAKEAVRADRVIVSARTARSLRGVRAVVQVSAVCAGGQ